MQRHLVSTCLLALLCATASVQAAETDGHLSLSLAPGFDSNPLELPETSLKKTEGAFYTELGVDAGLRIKMNRLLSFSMDLDGSVRSFGSDASDADRVWGQARAGVTLAPYRNGARGFAVMAGGTFGSSRSTYIDPATGESYMMFDGTNDVPVPDRFDSDTTGVFVDMRWRTHERLLFYLDSTQEWRRYVESYEPLLDPLDDSSLSFQPGVLLDLTSWMKLDVSYSWSDRSYDELAALDATATVVPGEQRAYHDNGMSVTFGFEPLEAFSFAIGTTSSTREDLYAGYYDNSGTMTFGSFNFKAGAKTRLNAFVGLRNLEYDNATVDSTTNGDTLDSERKLFVARAEHDLADRFVVFGEAGMDKSENNDPLFTYDRTWAHAGLRFRL